MKKGARKHREKIQRENTERKHREKTQETGKYREIEHEYEEDSEFGISETRYKARLFTISIIHNHYYNAIHNIHNKQTKTKHANKNYYLVKVVCNVYQ